jgi:asparagine synthase (glutamine-hydrolysing)
MFFAAIIGTVEEVARYEQMVLRHAAALDLRVAVDRRLLTGGTWATVCRMRYERADGASRDAADATVLDVAIEDGPVAAIRPEVVLASMVRHGEPTGIRLSIESTGSVTAIIPPATPEPLYVCGSFGPLVLTDDLRVMASVAGTEPEPIGLFALLRYGVIPPPFTFLRNVRRCPGASVVRLRPGTERLEIEPLALRHDVHPEDFPPRSAWDWLEQALDRALGAVPPNAELYFSGGVDSSLLATRLRRLGRNDIRYVHFSFGRHDPETAHARRVASALGVQLHEVGWSDGDIEAVLGRIGRDYSYPFGDASVLPANVLVHATLDRRSEAAAVVDGTGADGSFAVPCTYWKWHLLGAVPRSIRREAGEWYRRLGLWRSDAPMARWCQTVRRSAQLPLDQAAVAQNALDGIAYSIPPALDALLQASFETCLDAIVPDATPDARLGVLDLLVVCGAAMAKTFDPLRSRGVVPIYPYLSPAIVYGAALLPGGCKYRRGEAKSLLKEALARDVPPRLVYRPKSGFTPPYRRIFSAPALMQVLSDFVVSRDNPLLEFCRADVVRRIVRRASRGRLSVRGCDFLWSLAFSSLWLRQIREASLATGPTAPIATTHGAEHEAASLSCRPTPLPAALRS